MRPTGSDVAAAVLRDERVHFFFGIPGIQNLAMYAGLERAGSRAVLIANEESAAFAAAGVFEASGGTEIACVNIIGGPGVTHALAGIALAMQQQIPMLVLTAGIKTGAAHKSHRFQLHDVDNLGILRPVTKLAIAPASDGEIEDVLRRAVRVATTPPYGPVGVEMPSDMMGDFISGSLPAGKPPRPPTSNAMRTDTRPTDPLPVPLMDALDANAHALAAAAPLLCAALNAAIDADATFAADPGPCSALLAQLSGRRLLRPPPHASVGYAVPTAIGAALFEARARGDAASAGAPVVALSDPQALLMTGPELTTAANERLPLLILVPAIGRASGAAPPPFLFEAQLDLAAFAASFGFPYRRHAAAAGTADAAEAIRDALAELSGGQVRLEPPDPLHTQPRPSSATLPRTQPRPAPTPSRRRCTPPPPPSCPVDGT